nr:uncharacterized protein LOC112519506 isoform X2 [Ipomoea batatas]
MKVIGLMGSMMVMELRRGQGGAGIEANIGKDLGMVLEFIGFIQGMFMQENGQMGRVMGVGCIPVMTVADMLVNSNGVSSMALATTISGMVTLMLENILLIRCMDLGFIALQMGIVMKELGTKAGDKDWECILLEMEKLSQVTGKMGFLTFQAHKVCPILYLLLLFTIQKCLMQSRKHDEQLRKHMM